MKLVIVLAAFLALGALPLPVASAKASCRGGTTWVTNDLVRVYATSKPLPRRATRTTVYACTSARRTRLASWTTSRHGEKSASPLLLHPSDVRLARSTVAYRLSFVPYEPRMGTANQLVVRDAPTGRVLWRHGPPTDDIGVGIQLYAFVLKLNGSIAWIDSQNPHGVRVHVKDTAGHRVVSQPIPIGHWLEPWSLTLSSDETWLYWRERDNTDAPPEHRWAAIS